MQLNELAVCGQLLCWCQISVNSGKRVAARTRIDGTWRERMRARMTIRSHTNNALSQFTRRNVWKNVMVRKRSRCSEFLIHSLSSSWWVPCIGMLVIHWWSRLIGIDVSLTKLQLRFPDLVTSVMSWVTDTFFATYLSDFQHSEPVRQTILQLAHRLSLLPSHPPAISICTCDVYPLHPSASKMSPQLCRGNGLCCTFNNHRLPFCCHQAAEGKSNISPANFVSNL